MNARQKAKYYKRKYEELAYMKVPTLTIHEQTRPIEKIRFVREYPEALIAFQQNSKFIEDTLTKDLAFELARHIGDYATWKTDFDKHRQVYRYVGEIEVVRGVEG